MSCISGTEELPFWYYCIYLPTSNSFDLHFFTFIQLHLLKPDGSVQTVKLGDPIQDPDSAPQVHVAVGVWVAAELEDKITGYCLLSGVQAPGISR